MHPPRQAQVLAQGRRRQVGRAGGDVRLVAVDREIRRQRDLAVLARSLEVEVAVERAVEEPGQVSRSRASRAPGRAPRDTSGPARPTTRPACAGRRRPCRSAGCGRPGSARGGRPHRGRRPSAAAPRDASSAARRQLGLGFFYSTRPFSRQSRPSMRTACSRRRGSVLELTARPDAAIADGSPSIACQTQRAPAR